MSKTRNLELARKIKKFMKKHNLHHDSRIYFNGMAWNFDTDGKYKKMEETCAYSFLPYYNDEGITMSFEGGMYDMFEYNLLNSSELIEEFENILSEYNAYTEFGYAWNMAIYYN